VSRVVVDAEQVQHRGLQVVHVHADPSTML
jgi:hypothetical protein